MVKVDLEALKEQASSAKKASQQAKETLEDYQKAINRFKQDNQLKGKAYQAAKNYGAGPLTTLLKGTDAFYEEASLVLEKLVNQYEANVDSKSWDSEDLHRLIQQANRIISHLEHMVDQLQRHKKRQVGIHAYERTIDVFQEMKRQFELILHHLEEFSYESTSWFSQIQSVQSSLNSAISDLSNGLDVSSGHISIPKNRDWEQSLLEFNKQVKNFQLQHQIESLPKSGQLIIEDFKKTYDLDTQAAYSLYKLQQSILENAEKEHWSNKKIIFEYNRLLASCSYGVIPLKGPNSKDLDDFKLTNNSTYVATRWQALCQTEDWETAKKLLQKYGLSLSEIDHLRKAISVQHGLSSERDYNSNNQLDLSHEAVQLACFTEQPSKNMKRFVLHRGSHFINQKLEHEEISYKGDIDSGRIDQPDIFSDIDAINMYQRMTKVQSKDIFNTPVKYHQAIQSKKINRVDEFYKNNSLGTNFKNIGKLNVKVKINLPTFGSLWIQGKETTDKNGRQLDQQRYDDSVKKFWDTLSEEEQGGRKR